MTDLQDALDEAQYVKFYDSGFVVAVWHGSHTVNFYSVVGDNELTPTDTMSIGDYATGETTLQEAQDAIERRFEEYREE